ncbi:MAG: ABC transporter permease [Anaerolineae bacterium]|nr:ABC transporter permease [Anaerolineae bacterium]
MATTSGVSVPAAEPTRGRSTLGSILRAREFAIFAFLILISVAVGLVRPTFFTPFNLITMLRQMAELVIMGVAMTFLITTQELDLSVGSVYALSGLTLAILARDHGFDLWIALIIVMIIAAIIGFINGLITTRGRIPAFIVTLGALYIVRGITLLESPWPVEGGEHPTFFNVLAGEVAGIPVQIFWMIAITIVGTLVMRRTTFGYHVRATGSNAAAAVLSGIRVQRVKIQTFILTALAASFAAAMSFAHLTSASPTGGGGLELNVIAAVVIGGTSLTGGQGTVIGTFLGAALLTVMRNALVQLGGEGRLQEAFLGAIIIIAVLIHTHVGQRQGRRKGN